MKKIIYLTLCLMFAGLTNATAATNRFTATSFSAGVLGYLDYDSSIFDSTLPQPQFVDNLNMLGLSFTNPTNGFQITTIGPTGVGLGAYFDSTGSLPIFLGGNGTLGGAGQGVGDEVVVLTSGGGPGTGGIPNFLILGNGQGNNLFSDVTWSSSAVSPVAAVPEPEIYAMMGVGLAMLGWLKRRKKHTEIVAS